MKKDNDISKGLDKMKENKIPFFKYISEGRKIVKGKN